MTRTQHRLLLAPAALALSIMLIGGCTSNGPAVDATGTAAAVTQDAATRSTPVVVGRPARVFVFAGVGKNCEALPAPAVTITAPPAKGDITFKPGQETMIIASAQGTCDGRKSIGTGVYYTARAGSEGTDRFSVAATLAGGETTMRTFEVQIEQ